MNRKKVVCPCYHVTKGDIADALDNGAKNYKDVKKMTKAGKGCGKCKKKVKKLTKKLLKKKSAD
ncbi:MAG: (2Fe-2S)-binding protein [Eubacteriales bacterium]|nr:(2Fe-2S)-binding protein [Eubacteriales bacterium]